MPQKKQPLWTCPRCKHRFVTRNMWHSCSRHKIADHFKGKDRAMRDLYRRFRALVSECGPSTVYAQTTAIVFQTRARFAGVVVRRHWLDCRVWLKRRVDSPRFRRVETITSRDHIYYFRVSDPSELDDEIRALLREAYGVGCQESFGLTAPGREKAKLK